MVRFMRLFLLIFIFISAFYISNSSETQVEIYSRFELTFKSDYNYSNPYTDAKFYVEFCSDKNSKFKVYGFWAGSNTFKVRFMPRELGNWSWTLRSETPLDTFLMNKSGNFIVVENPSNNDFIQKGIPRISPNKRYLMHENGEPLFIVNEIAWRLPLSSLKDEVINYLSDRKSKGFNSVSLVIIDTFYEWGDSIRSGITLFSNYIENRINPEFFEYVDWCINTINDSGMVVFLTPLWGTISEPNFESQWFPMCFEKQKSYDYAKYCAARYAANNIIWIVGGDCNYNRPGSKDFWTKWAYILQSYSGGYQLITSHSMGYTGTYDFFPNSDWLDFHTYQSGHIIGVDYSWKGGYKAWNNRPIKPVINLEPSFEDLYEFRGDYKKIRIEYSDVRKAMYESIFSGAIVGLSYSANGIFNWYSPNLKVGLEPRYKIDSVIFLPGSGQVKLIKDFSVSIGWPNIIPCLELQNRKNEEKVIASCASDYYFAAYFPSGVTKGRFNLASLVNRNFSYKWVEPNDLTESEILIMDQTNLNDLEFTPPDTNAKILVVMRNDDSNLSNKNEPLIELYPNPAIDNLFIESYNSFDTDFTLDLYNALGKLLETYHFPNESSLLNIDLKHFNSGSYYIIARNKSKKVIKGFNIIK